jgi:hypothetical protein
VAGSSHSRAPSPGGVALSRSGFARASATRGSGLKILVSAVQSRPCPPFVSRIPEHFQGRRSRQGCDYRLHFATTWLLLFRAEDPTQTRFAPPRVGLARRPCPDFASLGYWRPRPPVGCRRSPFSDPPRAVRHGIPLPEPTFRAPRDGVQQSGATNVSRCSTNGRTAHAPGGGSVWLLAIQRRPCQRFPARDIEGGGPCRRAPRAS